MAIKGTRRHNDYRADKVFFEQQKRASLAQDQPEPVRWLKACDLT